MLKYSPDAKFGPLFHIDMCDIFTIKDHLSLVDTIEAIDDIQQWCFPTAVWPYDSDSLTRMYVHINSLDDMSIPGFSMDIFQ